MYACTQLCEVYCHFSLIQNFKMSYTSKVTDCIFCEAKGIKLHGHVRLCQGLPDSVTTKRFPNLTEQVSRALAEHVAMMTFGPSGKCYECPFCKVIKNHKGNSEVKKHIKQCFVANKIYECENFDVEGDVSDRISLVMNSLNSDQTELTNKINNLKSKWEIGEFDDPAFFWMHKNIPIPPPPPGFSIPNRSINHDEYIANDGSTSVVKQNVSPKPNKVTHNVATSTDAVLPHTQEAATQTVEVHMLNSNKAPDNPMIDVTEESSEFNLVDSVLRLHDVFHTLTDANIKIIPKKTFLSFFAHLKELAASIKTSNFQDAVPEKTAPVSPKIQDFTLVSPGQHESTASFEPFNDVHTTQDSTPTIPDPKESTASFSTYVQDDLPKTKDSTLVTHAPRSPGSFETSFQDDIPKTQDHVSHDPQESPDSSAMSSQADAPEPHDSECKQQMSKKRKRQLSEPAYEDADFDSVEDVEDEEDSTQYAANPLFAAGNNKFVDWSGKQQSISSLFAKMAVMGNNYDLEALHGFGLSLDRLQVNRDGYITGIILPNSSDLTPVEHLFEIKTSDDGLIYKLHLDKIDALSDVVAKSDISEFVAAFNLDANREDHFGTNKSIQTSDDILHEDKLTLLEKILPANENVVQIRERKGLNKRTGLGPNVQAFESWLLNNRHRKPRTVEQYIRHIRRIMYYVQKRDESSNKDIITDDIDFVVLENSFTSVTEYFLKLEKIPLRSCSLKNEWSSYVYLLRYVKEKALENDQSEKFYKFDKILQLQVAEMSMKYHKQATEEYNDDLLKRFQEGYRWKLQDILKVINDPAVESKVKTIYKKIDLLKTGQVLPVHNQITLQERIVFTRWLIFKIVVENFQRPGIVQTMTTDEFLKGSWVLNTEDPSKKHYCLSVRTHKTGGSKPAQLALSASEFTHMQDYLEYIRPIPNLEKCTKLQKLRHAPPSRLEQVINRCQKFQGKDESNIDFAQRRQKKKSDSAVSKNKEPFFLVPSTGRPIKNASTVLRQFLATNLHKSNIIPFNTPCWNATVARKLCETISNYSEELSGKDVTNINRYLNHTSAVANSHYVIDSHDTVIHTKTLINKHILKTKENDSRPIEPIQGSEPHSRNADSFHDNNNATLIQQLSETQGLPKDCTFKRPEIDYQYFSDLLTKTWPVHINGRLPSAKTIMEDIISKNSMSGKYFNCGKDSPEFHDGIQRGSIAFNLSKDYRSWRSELRAEIVADHFKLTENLTSRDVHEFLENFEPPNAKPQTAQPKLKKDCGHKIPIGKGQWAGEKKHITGPALRLWRAYRAKQT